MKYPWDKCEYVATAASSLNQHIESKHEGVRYPCSECEYAGTSTVVWNGILRQSIKWWDILVINVNTLQLQQAIWSDIMRVNMKKWDILVVNVNTPQLQQVFWGSMTRVNMKEWYYNEFLAINFTLLLSWSSFSLNKTIKKTFL